MAAAGLCLDMALQSHAQIPPNVSLIDACQHKRRRSELPTTTNCRLLFLAARVCTRARVHARSTTRQRSRLVSVSCKGRHTHESVVLGESLATIGDQGNPKLSAASHFAGSASPQGTYVEGKVHTILDLC